MKKVKTPWVFWFRISYRHKWFKRFWYTRGNNYLEVQCWILKISIGMPWLHNRIFNAKEANLANEKAPWSIPIGFGIYHR